MMEPDNFKKPVLVSLSSSSVVLESFSEKRIQFWSGRKREEKRDEILQMGFSFISCFFSSVSYSSFFLQPSSISLLLYKVNLLHGYAWFRLSPDWPRDLITPVSRHMYCNYRVPGYFISICQREIILACVYVNGCVEWGFLNANYDNYGNKQAVYELWTALISIVARFQCTQGVGDYLRR